MKFWRKLLLNQKEKYSKHQFLKAVTGNDWMNTTSTTTQTIRNTNHRFMKI